MVISNHNLEFKPEWQKSIFRTDAIDDYVNDSDFGSPYLPTTLLSHHHYSSSPKYIETYKVARIVLITPR